MWRHDFRDLSYLVLYKCYRLDLDVDFAIFWVEELEYEEENDVPLVRDLAGDWRHDFRDLAVWFTNNTRSILVSILPYSRSRNTEIRKEMMSGASFEGGWGAVAPPPKRKKKKKKKKKEKREKRLKKEKKERRELRITSNYYM